MKIWAALLRGRRATLRAAQWDSQHQPPSPHLHGVSHQSSTSSPLKRCVTRPLSGEVGRGVMQWGARLSFIPHPLSSACKGNGWRQWGLGWEKIKACYWVSARRGAPDPVPPLQVIRPEPCRVCGSRIRFGKTAIKCCQCQLLLHTKCREQCPSLCTPRPHHHAWPHEVRGARQCSPCPHEASGLLALEC